MLMATILLYPIAGITSGNKFCRELKIAAILEVLKY